MGKQEKIVCAAVKFTDNGGRSDISSIAMCVYYSDEKLNDVRSDNLAYGIIATETNGFITNKNRFVDAKEAMQIAIKEGQIKELAELDLIIREFEEYEEESGIETNQLISARESYGEFYHQFSCRELKPEDLY